MVTNAYGSIVSSNAVLTVSPRSALAPAGLVSWWPAEGNANDIIGTNHGSFQGNATTVSTGMVNSAFNFTGSTDCVYITNSASLNPSSSFTIETWVYPRTDGFADLVSKWGDRYDLSDQRSYHLSLDQGRVVYFAISDTDHQRDASFHQFKSGPNAVTLQAWNHLAAVYDQTNGIRRIYVNGVEITNRTDSPITVLNGAAPLSLGAGRPGSTDVVNPFDGLLDEVSFYSRALSASEIQSIYNAGSAGKCLSDQLLITTQPSAQAVVQGSNATFAVTVEGALPIGYQWRFNGTNIAGATSTSCTLTNTSLSNAGGYSVLVTNPVGSVESIQATLTVVSTNWLAQYFGANFRTNASAGLFADPDGDGVLNWQESLRGQNPTNATSLSDSGNLIQLRVYTPLR